MGDLIGRLGIKNLKVMYNTYIFELSETPIMPQDRIGSMDLEDFFPSNNPFWAEVGEPLEVVDSERHEALECLKNELPLGYSMDLANESIDIINSEHYFQETINRLQNIRAPSPYFDALGWWKKEVCLFCDILIYFEEELFTLNEFLLYMVRVDGDGVGRKLYVGGVFEYYI